MYEADTVLGDAAARTERVRLGTIVTAVALRPSALLVKAITTLDVLSGGQAWLGIGAGYHAEGAQALGLPLPAVAERFERLEEALQVAVRMWAGTRRRWRASTTGCGIRSTAPAWHGAPARRS